MKVFLMMKNVINIRKMLFRLNSKYCINCIMRILFFQLILIFSEIQRQLFEKGESSSYLVKIERKEKVKSIKYIVYSYWVKNN